jgi:hypothetical protein
LNFNYERFLRAEGNPSIHLVLMAGRKQPREAEVGNNRPLAYFLNNNQLASLNEQISIWKYLLSDHISTAISSP